jgi:hypothetical protein
MIKGEHIIVCISLSGSLRGAVATKPCPEQSEGTHEIATGFALATTFHVGLPRLRAETLIVARCFDGALRRAGTPFGLAMTTSCDSKCKLFHVLGIDTIYG